MKLVHRWAFWGALACVVPAVAVACTDDTITPRPASDAGPGPTTSATTNPTGTPPPPFPDSGPVKLKGCLDRPNAAPRPDRLPCELIPPGVTL